MIVDVRPTDRLRGTHPVDLTGCLGPLVDALCEENVDLSKLRVVCDWVQYENNFRNAIDIRPLHRRVNVPNGASTNTTPPTEVELAVDLRRCADAQLGPIVRDTFGVLSGPNRARRLYLEPWTRGTDSCIWEFNSLYWRYLGDWEQATGRHYEQALPGGESDGRNADAARALILDLFATWDELAARNALPDELYVVELGVGNGNQAKTWFDEFARLDTEHGRDYYRRLQYLMCDNSQHVLDLARAAVTDHITHVSSFVLDATTPSTALKFLHGKVFLVYISNMYDNLPTEEIAHIGGHTYRVETRAYLPTAFVDEITAELGCDTSGLRDATGKLLRLGPQLLAEAVPGLFPDPTAAAGLWQRLWHALRLEERYVALPGLDLHQITEDVSGDLLRPMLDVDGDVRMHVSNGAVASLTDTLPLLHPHGQLQCHDLFTTSTRQYRDGFRGPGKYDGSVVNWVNGPLLRRIASRHGFAATYAPFRHRIGTNIVTMTARPA